MAYREMELTKTSAPVDYHAANEYDTKVYGVMQEVIAQSSADGAEESAPSTNSSLKS